MIFVSIKDKNKQSVRFCVLHLFFFWGKTREILNFFLLKLKDSSPIDVVQSVLWLWTHEAWQQTFQTPVLLAKSSAGLMGMIKSQRDEIRNNKPSCLVALV